MNVDDSGSEVDVAGAQRDQLAQRSPVSMSSNTMVW